VATFRGQAAGWSPEGEWLYLGAIQPSEGTPYQGFQSPQDFAESTWRNMEE
jgi:hypothetical protein